VLLSQQCEGMSSAYCEQYLYVNRSTRLGLHYGHSQHSEIGKWTVPQWTIPPSDISPNHALLAFVRVRIWSGVSRVRLGSAGLELGLGLWSGLGGNVRHSRNWTLMFRIDHHDAYIFTIMYYFVCVL